MTVPLPTKEHLDWADREVGVIIHLDMPVFEPEYHFREQWGYTPSVDRFAPLELDTDQWLETAAKAGTKYAVLTAKHCSGFCLWPTKAHDYHVGNSPWKKGDGDVVGDVLEVKFDKPEKVTHAVIMEDIRQGENVLSYTLESFTGKEWLELTRGSCIGHKRIERFPETMCQAFRLRCLETKATPRFRSLELFCKAQRVV